MLTSGRKETDSYVDWKQIGKEDSTSDIWDPTKFNNEQDKMVFVKNTGDYTKRGCFKTLVRDSPLIYRRHDHRLSRWS